MQLWHLQYPVNHRRKTCWYHPFLRQTKGLKWHKRHFGQYRQVPCFQKTTSQVAKPVDSSCMLVITSNTGLLEGNSSLSDDHFLQHADCLRGRLPLRCRCWNAMCDKFTSYHSIVWGLSIPRESKPTRVPSSDGRAALSRVCLDINIKQMPYAMLMSSVSVSLKDRRSWDICHAICHKLWWWWNPKAPQAHARTGRSTFKELCGTLGLTENI